MIHKKILIIAPYPIVSPQHGGQKRLHAIVDHYKNIFARVDFKAIYNPNHYIDRGENDLLISDVNILSHYQKMPYNAAMITGRALYDDPHIKHSLIEYINREKPDIIEIEQPFFYDSLLKLLKECRVKPKIILSSHNIESDMKKDTFIDLGVGKDVYQPIVEQIEKLERKVSQEADFVFAVSNEDAEDHRRLGTKDVLTIPNGIARSVPSKRSIQKWETYLKKHKITKPILFVGSGHAPNWKGFEKMVGTDLSYLDRGAKIFLVGAVSDYFKQNITDKAFWEKVEALGRVDESDLSALLHVSDTILLPILSGGGSNLKTAEALLANKKIVASKFAFRGYEEFIDLPNVRVVSSSTEFKKAITKSIKSSLKARSAKQQETVDSVEWASRLFPLERSIKKALNYPQQTVYIDVTTLYKGRGLTGIQRVVRSLLPYFMDNTEGYDAKAIFYDDTRGKYAVFANHDMKELASSLHYEALNPTHEIEITQIKDGDIFFDIDLVWSSKPDRRELYAMLKSNNAKVYTYIYDLTPIYQKELTHPQTQKDFPKFLEAVYEYADMVMTDSRSSEKDFLQYKMERGVDRHISTLVTGLGSDFALKSKNDKYPKRLRKILWSKYILFVGTLEPRKDQELLFDTFKKIHKHDKKLKLVFVGRQGWSNERFITKLTQDELFNRNVFWLKDVDDYDLEKLYKKSFLNVYLSKHEGYGLPVAEALKYNRPIITSRNSSMYEVGLDFADYVQFGSENELESMIRLYSNKSFYKNKVNKIKRYYGTIQWGTVYKTIHKAIVHDLNKPTLGTEKNLQHVVISIRPDDFERCIRQTDRYSSMVKEYVVITQKKLMPIYKNIKSKHKIIVVDEQKLLGKEFDVFVKAPHQKKNWMLRAAVPRLKLLDEQYIMLDDDNLPIRRVGIEHYIENGRYKAYFYNDLLSQKRIDTSYDIGQQQTTELLQRNHLELLSYSSHCPQVINKTLFSEMLDKLQSQIGDKQVDEWSMYFNYVATNYPTMVQKNLYETLNWPAHPNDWQFNYVPSKYTYENYYSHIYEDTDNFFYGLKLSSPLSEKLAIKKEQHTPHLVTKKLRKAAFEYCRELNMVHGDISFKGDDGDTVKLFGVPYIFAAQPHMMHRIEINFKILKPTHGAEYQILVQNSAGLNKSEHLKVQTDYAVNGLREGWIELPIHCGTTGIKDINFVVQKNGKDMRTASGRYDSVSIGCEEDVSFEKTVEALDSQTIDKSIER